MGRETRNANPLCNLVGGPDKTARDDMAILCLFYAGKSESCRQWEHDCTPNMVVSETADKRHDEQQREREALLSSSLFFFSEQINTDNRQRQRIHNPLSDWHDGTTEEERETYLSLAWQ